jgi:hypothetical protein
MLVYKKLQSCRQSAATTVDGCLSMHRINTVGGCVGADVKDNVRDKVVQQRGFLAVRMGFIIPAL